MRPLLGLPPPSDLHIPSAVTLGPACTGLLPQTLLAPCHPRQTLSQARLSPWTTASHLHAPASSLRPSLHHVIPIRCSPRPASLLGPPHHIHMQQPPPTDSPCTMSPPSDALPGLLPRLDHQITSICTSLLSPTLFVPYHTLQTLSKAHFPSQTTTSHRQALASSLRPSSGRVTAIRHPPHGRPAQARRTSPRSRTK